MQQTLEHKGHPPSLFILFFTEMWERFSYYGTRALLVLFLVTSVTGGGWAWERKEALQLYAVYTGLVYLTPIISKYNPSGPMKFGIGLGCVSPVGLSYISKLISLNTYHSIKAASRAAFFITCFCSKQNNNQYYLLVYCSNFFLQNKLLSAPCSIILKK